MSRAILVQLILLISVAAIHSQKLAAQEVTKVQLCQGVWPPYTFGIEGQPPTHGLALEFVTAISQRIDVPMSIQLLPWKRCLRMAETAQVDGISLLTRNSERENFLEFTNHLISDNNLIWHLADRRLGEHWESFEDLQGLRIGVASGFNYGDEFNAAKIKYRLKVDKNDDILNNFRKLALGRTDVFFVNLAVANDALKEEPDLRKKLTYVDKLFDKVPFHMGLSKGSKAITLLPEINSTIEELKNDGTIQHIMK